MYQVRLNTIHDRLAVVSDNVHLNCKCCDKVSKILIHIHLAYLLRDHGTSLIPLSPNSDSSVLLNSEAR